MSAPAFELDRFTWRPGELEVRGEWRSERPRRFRRVRLVIDGDGRRRRIAPREPAPLRAGPDGEEWGAVFEWGADDPPRGACLEVGTDLLVELPAPDRDGAAVRAVEGSPSGGAEDAAARLESVDARARAAGERATAADERATAAEKRARVAAERAATAEARARTADERAAEAAREAREAIARLEGELRAERSAMERLRKEVAKEREDLEQLKRQVAGAPGEPSRPAPPRPPAPGRRPDAPRPTLRTYDPHARPRTPLELPRTPSDPVAGEAPTSVRLIAVALAAGVLLAMILILSALF